MGDSEKYAKKLVQKPLTPEVLTPPMKEEATKRGDISPPVSLLARGRIDTKKHVENKKEELRVEVEQKVKRGELTKDQAREESKKLGQMGERKIDDAVVLTKKKEDMLVEVDQREKQGLMTRDEANTARKEIKEANNLQELLGIAQRWNLEESIKSIQNEINKQKTQKSSSKDKTQAQSAEGVANIPKEKIERTVKEKIKGMGKKKALENLDKGKQADANKTETATILSVTSEGVKEVPVKVVKPDSKQE